MLQYGRWLVFAAALLVVPAFAQDATQESTAEPVMLPDEIAFISPAPGLLPEGIEWDAAQGRFLVGSLSQGTIHSITPNEDGTGTVEAVIEDEELMSTVGLEVDEVNNRLIVSNSEASAFAGGAGAAMLAAYDLETNERVYMVDLAPLYESATNFVNDVTVDDEGNAYATNSFAPVLYKVTPEGEASVLIEDEQLTGGFIGTNGIVFHPDGYLLVTNSGTQSLLKVTLGDEVTITPVELDMPFGADGMILADDGTLYAVANLSQTTQSILSVVSEDDWQTAAVTDLGATTDAATTITLVGDRPYYINAYLGDNTRTEYQIVGVTAMMPDPATTEEPAATEEVES
jgi:sugar lactone lactonase YvrE